MTKVTVYSKPNCHLCEEAKAVIHGADCEGQFILEEVNIESDADLLKRYQYDIPVITIDGVVAFRHRVSSEEFRKALRTAQNS